MEKLVADPGFWRGRRVFVTGHTGFKGGWLALWLSRLGALVHGYALPPPTHPSLFVVADVERQLADHVVADIRDAAALRRALIHAAPEVVFHLAAQPLVGVGYDDPVATFATNVLGTANLLEAVRAAATVRAVVVVTTDKCYSNREWHWPYRETDGLGGDDPYSASKACAELVTAAMRASFLAAGSVGVATARAGNVIGGGDWAAQRLVPDALRAFAAGTPLNVRRPAATRPWQHVLEPLGGYLRLAERLTGTPAEFARAWNFGPIDEEPRAVNWVLDQLAARLPGFAWTASGGDHHHEAGHLRLDSSDARQRLGWRPRWSLDAAIDATVAWDAAWRCGKDMHRWSLAQIDQYVAAG